MDECSPAGWPHKKTCRPCMIETEWMKHIHILVAIEISVLLHALFIPWLRCCSRNSLLAITRHFALL